MPGGTPPESLGFAILPDATLELPLGLAAPAPEDGLRLVHSLRDQGGPRGGAGWWTGAPLRQSNVTLVLSAAAISLNTQAVGLLRAGEASGATCLAILAPIFAGEAWATLLTNDLMRTFPRGVLPLRTLVAEPHVAETIDLIANLLDLPPWDGRPGTAVTRQAAELQARMDGSQVRLAPTGGGAGLGRVFRRVFGR